MLFNADGGKTLITFHRQPTYVFYRLIYKHQPLSASNTFIYFGKRLEYNTKC